ncbi:MAG: HAD-IA family hydrolase [Pseudomonadota bacterium]
MSNALKLVIFDVDGTLVDSQDHIVASMDYAFQQAGRAVPSRAEALGIVGLSLPEAMRVLAPDAQEDEVHQLARHYKTGNRQHREDGAAVARGPMFDGAMEAIHRLNDTGYLLSAATGKSRAGLVRFLEAQGLTKLFLATQTADDAPSKPHPQMVLNCLSGTGVDAPNAVMIGDTEFDMAMGRAAGARTIGVRWGYHAEDRVLRGGAERMVDHFGVLHDTVEDLLGTP